WPGHAIAISHGLLGNASLKMGDPRAAREHYRDSLRGFQALPKEFVKYLDRRQEIAAAHQRLGLTSLRSGDLAQGQKYCASALEQRRGLAGLGVKTALEIGLRRDCAYSLMDQGDVELEWRDDPARALSFYRPAAQELQAISAEWRESRAYRDDVGVGHYR